MTERPLVSVKSVITNFQRVMNFMSKVLVLVALVVVNYAAETAEYGSFIKELWSRAKEASPFVAMFTLLMFLDERKERREAQRECSDRTIDFIETNNIAYRAVDRFADAVAKRRR